MKPPVALFKKKSKKLCFLLKAKSQYYERVTYNFNKIFVKYLGRSSLFENLQS